MMYVDDAHSKFEIIASGAESQIEGQWQMARLAVDLASVGGAGKTNENVCACVRGLAHMAFGSLTLDFTEYVRILTMFSSQAFR